MVGIYLVLAAAVIVTLPPSLTFVGNVSSPNVLNILQCSIIRSHEHVEEISVFSFDDQISAGEA